MFPPADALKIAGTICGLMAKKLAEKPAGTAAHRDRKLDADDPESQRPLMADEPTPTENP